MWNEAGDYAVCKYEQRWSDLVFGENYIQTEGKMKGGMPEWQASVDRIGELFDDGSSNCIVGAVFESLERGDIGAVHVQFEGDDARWTLGSGPWLEEAEVVINQMNLQEAQKALHKIMEYSGEIDDELDNLRESMHKAYRDNTD